MKSTYKEKAVETQEKNIKDALRILKKGGVIVYPTDTVYGLGANATDSGIVERLRGIKNRNGKPISIIVSDITMAKEFVKFSPLAKKIFKENLPGPITLVLPLKKFVPEAIKVLSANTDTLGIRIPDNSTAMTIVERFGKPITTTSANPRGGIPPHSIEESREQFRQKNRELQPDFYFDEGILPNNPPSTIIKILKNEIEIIREGSISTEEILGERNESNM